MNKSYAMLLCGVAAAGIGLPQASAQQAAEVGTSSSNIMDIVVTAQRREERAQDVPVVVTAFSEERLEQLNVTEPQDLNGNVPSLLVGTQGQGSRDVQSFSIRGQSTGFLALPSVATYLAEVPLVPSISLSLQGGPGQFVDLANVQVLSGPQGTLFGRNTTGGAVLLTPQRPTNRFEGYLEAAIGNLDLRSIEGAINVPIIEDKLLVRVSGAFYDRRGFTRDLVWDKWRDDQHWYTGRVGITLKPTERLENNLLVYGSKSRNNGAGHIHKAFNLPFLGCPPTDVSDRCNIYRQQTAIAEENGPRKTRPDVDSYNNIDAWGVINTTDFEISDELTLRNIVSFQKLKSDYGSDLDGTPVQLYQQSQYGDFPDFPIPGFTDLFDPPFAGYRNEKSGSLPRDYLKQITEELQLQGRALDEKLTYSLGAFYINTKPAGLWGSSAVQNCPVLNTGDPVACSGTFSRSGVTNQSKALYAQGTLDLGVLSDSLDKLRFTAGIRHTWDTVRGFSSSWLTFQPGSALPGAHKCLFGSPASNGVIVPAGQDPAEGCEFTGNLKTKAFTWTLGLDYRPIDNLLTYGKVSRGYKAGGFNSFAIRAETATFKPEQVTSYELGFKSDWRLGSVPLRLNAAYYYSDYKNIQRPGGDADFGAFAFGAQILSAQATIQGFELEASIQPVKGIEIGGTLSHTDADYKKFEFTSAFGTDFTCLPGGGFAPVGVGGTVDATCAPFQFVTPWVYNVHANIDLPVAKDLGTMSLFVNYSHVAANSGSPFQHPDNEPGAVMEPYGLLSASLDWRDIGQSGFDLSLFVKNATNKLYRVSNASVFRTSNVWSTLYGEPRTYGLKLRYRFGG